MQPSLNGCVCLVTGSSRGIGKGIALGLGKCGATVYLTGRTLKPAEGGPGGSLEETAEEIRKLGGNPIPVVVDHSNDQEVENLFKRIDSEQNGQLDVLVNNAYAAVPHIIQNLDKPFYKITDKSPGEAWDIVNHVGLRNHYICSVLATRMMLAYQDKLKQENKSSDELRPGLIVNISSVGGKVYLFNVAYGIGKAAVDRMASDMAHDLRKENANICVISLWPGFVRTEEFVSAQKNKLIGQDFNADEYPELSGSVIACLASEPSDRLMKRSGQIILVSDVADEYDLRQPDGSKPRSLRSIQTILSSLGYSFGSYVPNFVRIPKWLLLKSMSKQ